ncbi:Putative E3 ubiquitin-protein ligase XBAT34 [Dendrobium catenatum]|uniref:E3 ubiquitin-protein ligase XBAT34 n=1 Tax=Dendrobium catenatum TaxID=906689 RepID=A0A2I0W0P8_9ASPA|nr:Putative E3 ubiquitin-protein ligase XBAT34 [Dendrobium catenatum]
MHHISGIELWYREQYSETIRMHHVTLMLGTAQYRSSVLLFTAARYISFRPNSIRFWVEKIRPFDSKASGFEGSMGVNQSKEELLYQQVNYGNIEGIKALNREGAKLEWIDKEGKTPLILACMRPDLLHVAKALIELGANVNAYRPGSHAGTPLHHAAKRGLDSTVMLLLSHGANPLVMNDDCQTPLELARAKGHSNVVRAIENRICLFVGWLREIHGPSILEAFAPQWVSKKIWAVVVPCDSRNPTNPRKFELAIYPDLQHSNIVPVPPPAAPPLPNHLQAPNTPIPEDVQLSMAINASIQTALVEGVSLPHGQQVSPIDATNDWGSSSANPNASAAQLHTGQIEAPAVSCSSQESHPSITVPSAPPILDEAVYGGPIHYPSIDSSPVYFTVPPIERSAINSIETKEDDGNNASSSTCVICLDKPVEGACIPCGHMAGCMSCLKEIKEKKGDCPVCRAKIDQVVRLYVV